MKLLPRSARLLATAGNSLLLVFPSTRAALTFARALCSERNCLVTSGPIVGQARWGLTPHLRTPAQIVKELAGQLELSTPVISFPDQLIGDGDSFAPLRFLGEERHFSLLEALLVLRHRPRVYGLRTCALGMASRLIEIPYQDTLAPRGGTAVPLLLMQRLLSELEAELARPSTDWLAAACFALKKPAAFAFRRREELKDIEALLRLGLLSCNGGRTFLAPLLRKVTAQIRTGASTAATTQPQEDACTPRPMV